MVMRNALEIRLKMEIRRIAASSGFAR